MKTSQLKCPRCGKVFEIDYKHASEKIKCPHCNFALERDDKTRRHILISGIVLGFIFILIVAAIMTIFFADFNDTKTLIILVVVVGLISNRISVRLGESVSFMVRPFTYRAIDLSVSDEKKGKKKK